MRKRCLVIGLDGVPYQLLKRLMERGLMPALSNLCSQAIFGPMEVCLPPLSSVSWSSFMTGKDPSYHGIYGFTDLESDYRFKIYSFLDLKEPTIFDSLGQKGIKSIVINLPATYPARSIPGVLISGFVAVELRQAVYPKSFLPYLESLNYRIDIDLIEARKDRELLFKELKETLLLREKVADYLWQEIPWDFFMLVITGTDRLHHFAYTSLENEKDPYHQASLEYYREIDRVIEKMVSRFFENFKDRLLVILSDHGFCPLKREIYLNQILVQEGFLAFKNSPPELISDFVPEKTRAFVLDPGRVYIHLKDRFSKGIVDQREKQRLIEELTRLFLDFTYEGKKVILKIVKGEEIYLGPEKYRAPDLIIVPYPGYDVKGGVSPGEIVRETDLQGMHTHDNAFYLIDLGDELHPDINNILDVSRTIQQFFGD